MEETKGRFSISEKDKSLIESILTKVGEARKSGKVMELISLNDLRAMLANDESAIIDRVCQINPKLYGFKGPFVGIEEVPNDLVKVDPQLYTENGEQKRTHAQYLPPSIHRAYTKMSQVMYSDIGRQLLIESAYRSIAYQVITFLGILKKLYNYDVNQAIKRVAMPGYSQHGTPSSLALDFLNEQGSPTNEDPQGFADTPEYKWLTKNAANFGFYLSYPKNNPYGIMFEPWHWRHLAQ